MLSWPQCSMLPSLQVFPLVQDYYREVEQIEELKRAVQFPKLENLPSDFLTQMEGYVKEAPRPLDEAAVAAKKVPFCVSFKPLVHPECAPHYHRLQR